MAKKKRSSKRKARRDNQRGSIIRNMGLFWSINLVQWSGVPGNPAVLLGTRPNEKTREPIDFWDQAGVYALYADYQLVYVGQAGAGGNALLGNRLRSHTRDDLAGRWDRFSWFGFRKVSRRKRNRELEPLDRVTKSVKWTALADVVEGLFIEVAEPPLNGQGGRFGKRIHRFLQVASPHIAEAEAQNPVLVGLSRVRKSIEDSVAPGSALSRQLDRLAAKLDRVEDRVRTLGKKRKRT